MSTVAIVRTTYMTSTQFRDVVNGKARAFRNGQTWTSGVGTADCQSCRLLTVSLKTRLTVLFRTYID